MYEASLSHFDLIVFDISSDQLAGVETVKVIRQLEEFSGQRARIIGVGEEAEPLLENGLDGYIQRPVTESKTLQLLEAAA
jgi:CheY-like chemotaxis protein